MPPSLPTELVLQILGSVTRLRDLARCCRLSHGIHDFLTPRLYAVASFRAPKPATLVDLLGPSGTIAESMLDGLTRQLYGTLVAHPSLGALVRRVVFLVEEPSDHNRARLLQDLLRVCPRAEAVDIYPLKRYWAETDHMVTLALISETVARPLRELCIGGWVSEPGERHGHGLLLFPDLEVLKIIDMDDEPFEHSRAMPFHLKRLDLTSAVPPSILTCLLGSSRTSLRHLTIAIDEHKYDLTSFVNLSTLTVQISLTDWDARKEHRALARNLAAFLSSAYLPPSLTSLTIQDVGSDVKLNVLEKAGILHNLPPSLIHVDVSAISLTTAYLYEVFAHLPGLLPNLRTATFGDWKETDFWAAHYNGVEMREAPMMRYLGGKMVVAREKRGQPLQVVWGSMRDNSYGSFDITRA